MSEPLWTSQEIAAATGGRLDGADFAVSGVSIDTRTLEPGDLFCARLGPAGLFEQPLKPLIQRFVAFVWWLGCRHGFVFRCASALGVAQVGRQAIFQPCAGGREC